MEKLNRYVEYKEKQSVRKDAREEGLKEGYQQGIERGLEKGIEKGIEQTVINMLNEGMDISLISKVTGMTEEDINRLK